MDVPTQAMTDHGDDRRMLFHLSKSHWLKVIDLLADDVATTTPASVADRPDTQQILPPELEGDEFLF